MSRCFDTDDDEPASAIAGVGGVDSTGAADAAMIGDADACGGCCEPVTLARVDDDGGAEVDCWSDGVLEGCGASATIGWLGELDGGTELDYCGLGSADCGLVRALRGESSTGLADCGLETVFEAVVGPAELLVCAIGTPTGTPMSSTDRDR